MGCLGLVKALLHEQHSHTTTRSKQIMSQPLKVVCGTCDKWIPYSPDMKTGTVLCSAYGIGDWTEKCCWDCSDEKDALIEKNIKELTTKLQAKRKAKKN